MFHSARARRPEPVIVSEAGFVPRPQGPPYLFRMTFGRTRRNNSTRPFRFQIKAPMCTHADCVQFAQEAAADCAQQLMQLQQGHPHWSTEAQAAAARPLQVGARYTIFGWFSLCLIAVFGLSGCPVLESVLVWRCFQSRIMIPVSESLAGFPPFGKGETTCGGTIRDYLATT